MAANHKRFAAIGFYMKMKGTGKFLICMFAVFAGRHFRHTFEKFAEYRL